MVQATLFYIPLWLYRCHAVPPLHNRTQSKQLFKHRISEEWNILPHKTLTSTSLRSFKANLRDLHGTFELTFHFIC